MAKVIVQIVGGSPQEKTFSTVAEAKQALGVPNHAATLTASGETMEDGDSLNDGDWIILSAKTKGADESVQLSFEGM